MSIANGLALPNPLSNGTTADAVPVMADFNYLLGALNRALLDAGGGAGMNAQNTQIHNLASGSTANDAVNLSQLGSYALLAGASNAFTGNITIGGTLGVTGATTLAALTASGLITGNAGFSGTTLSLTGNAGIGGALTLSANNVAFNFTDANTGHPFFVCQSDNNFVFYGTDATGAQRGIWSVVMHSGTSSFLVNVPASLGALTASGLITGNAGFSGTTLALSGNLTVGVGGTLTANGPFVANGTSTLASATITGNGTVGGTFGVTGASTLAALSATTGSFSSTLGVTGQTTLGNVTGTPNGTAVNGLGYIGLPTTVKTANYQLQASDIGQDITFNGTGLTCTIPAGLPNGFACTVTNINASALIITSTTDTLTWSGTTSTGNRTVGQNGEVGLRRKNGGFLISGTAMS